MDEIINAIVAERQRQQELYGEENHAPEHWTGIPGEELGEWCQAVSETVLETGSGKGGYENMRKEAVHVAAVAVNFLKCLERNKEKWGLD